MSDLIVALDVETAEDALSTCDRLGEVVDWYKIGAPLFTRAGPAVIRELRARGKRIFLDLKYHDIPHTVGRAVEAAVSLDVELLTVHAAGGPEMLREARRAAGARRAASAGGPRLLAVTLLTSMNAAAVESVRGREPSSLREDVLRLAALAAESELDGVVASALEVETLKRLYGDGFVVVTPGIRPAGAESGDQVRTATPGAAIRAGSDYLVVGRPILHAEDPGAAAAAIMREIHAAQRGTEA